MTKVNRDNYITIQGWMISELKLKGNELLIYAIIYGFSQLDGQTFNGSRQYLADWTNSTTRGVQKNLNNLVDKGYILKTENVVNGVKCCDYSVSTREQSSLGQGTKFTGGREQSSLGQGTKFTGGREQSSHNNIDIYTSNNIDNIKHIVDYLNNKAGTNYRYTTKKTQTLINARLKEKFTIKDFETVIDNKCAEWLGNEKMQDFLRPETLFGTKFESYLNQRPPKHCGINGITVTAGEADANNPFERFNEMLYGEK